MKHLLLFPILTFVTLFTQAQQTQHYEVLTYSLNSTPTNGIKIKTNLPFTNSSQMPTIIIEGYCYQSGEPIGLMLNYYIFNDAFTKYKVSSFGSYNPPVFLANEGGKVVIFLNAKVSYPRFNVRAIAKGLPADLEVNYRDWAVADEALSSADRVQVPYQNRFSGDVYMPGGGMWDSSGAVTVTGLLAKETKDTIASIRIKPATSNAARISGVFDAFEWPDVNNSATALFGIANNTWAAPTPSTAIVSTRNGTGVTKDIMMWAHDSPSAGNPAICIKANSQNIGIGTATPGAKLSVNGDVFAKKVKVVQAGWADFVFEPEYNLPSLQELERFVKEHKHLPGVPTAAEVEKEGLDIGEMNRRLLQKVEELTLHIIEMSKEIKQLQKKNRE